MPDHMPLQEAWAILGRDAGALLASVAGLRREDRPAALRGLAEEARRLARGLLAQHHPDRGGDPAAFRRVQVALDSVVHHTDEFERRAAEAARRAEGAAERRPVFIDVRKR